MRPFIPSTLSKFGIVFRPHTDTDLQIHQCNFLRRHVVSGGQSYSVAFIGRYHVFPPIRVGGDIGAEVLQKRVWHSAEEIDADVLDAPVERLGIEEVAYELSVLLDFFVLPLLLHDLNLLWLQTN